MCAVAGWWICYWERSEIGSKAIVIAPARLVESSYDYSRRVETTCDAIVQEFQPLKVILFGSHAYGTPTEDSDVDLLIVMDVPESATRQKAVEIRRRIPRHSRMDLLVRSPEEIAYRLAHNDWFMQEIIDRGQVLYESADAGVGAKS
jgi:predicted nucleotidyltransferase